MTEPIERANRRIIHALGVDAEGRPDVADPRCAERSRVMRLAGTINHKSGAWARILEADLALDPYAIDELVGDLPDPPGVRVRHRGVRAPHPIRTSGSRRPSTSGAWPASTSRAAGSSRARSRATATATRPAASAREPEQGWCCHSASCGARGAIYDLASVLDGGPWGRAAARRGLRARARARHPRLRPMT